MLNRKWFQDSKPEMEFHMINIMYVALSIRVQTEKTTFSCKDDCTLTKHTWRWTYSALLYFFSSLDLTATRMFYFGKEQKTPDFGCLVHIHGKSSQGWDLLFCTQWVFFIRTRWNKWFCFWKNVQDAKSTVDFGTLRGQKCCVIKFRSIYIVWNRFAKP